MPGVSTAGGNNAFDARINGGLQSGDEASLDGVSMQQGFMSQGGMVSIFQDFPMSPDMVSEVKVLTSNYAPEYGSTTGGQIMAVTKSGGTSSRRRSIITDQDLKARQWGSGSEAGNHSLRCGHRRPAIPGLTTASGRLLLLRVRGYRQRAAQPADAPIRRCQAAATSATGATPRAT
jgi:outer membrane receptor protein involved in Fe transport